MNKGYIITLSISWASIYQSEYFAYYKNGNIEEISETEYDQYNDYNIDPDYLAGMDDDYEKREQVSLYPDFCFETIEDAKNAVSAFKNKLEEEKGYFLTNISGRDSHNFEICEVLY